MNVEGTTILILPIDFDSGCETDLDRQQLRDELQARAKNAGLPGTVIIVWQKAFGDMEFLSPLELHDAISKLSFENIRAGMNTELSWE